MPHNRLRSRSLGIGAGALALALASVISMSVSANAGTAPSTPGPQALDPTVAPGGNFDLSKWELELPTGSKDNTTTISPAKLEGASGYQSKYFYTLSSDGSMSFWDPENGVTLGSSYPRTELREMTSGGQPAEWSIPGTHTLSATLKVAEVPDHVAVGQIHVDNSSPGSKPLLELFYYSNGNVVLFLEQTPAGGNGVPHTIGNVPLGTKWSYVIELSGGNTISVKLNGTNHTWSIPSAFNGHKMYFKAGDYDQTAGSSSTVGGKVRFYALTFHHSS